MNEFWLSLGSNEEPQKHLPACVELLKKSFRVTAISSFYETKPVGMKTAAKFWNAAAVIQTPLAHDSVKKKITEIEARLGRRRDPQNKFSARAIDIDILPQPGYEKRAFCVVPLAEILPDAIDPVSGKPFRQLASAFPSLPRIPV